MTNEGRKITATQSLINTNLADKELSKKLNADILATMSHIHDQMAQQLMKPNPWMNLWSDDYKSPTLWQRIKRWPRVKFNKAGYAIAYFFAPELRDE